MFLNYTLAKNRNDSDGAFAVPAFGDINLDWGPANNDVRHRLNATLNNQIIKNLQVSLSFNSSSAPPYTIRTGLDDNGDLIFNDRPDGIGRNTVRGDGAVQRQPERQLRLDLRAAGRRPAADWRLHQRRGRVARGAHLRSAGALPDRRVPVREQPHQPSNYVGYSGMLTSPFYGQPTAVTGTRRVEMGLNFGF